MLGLFWKKESKQNGRCLTGMVKEKKRLDILLVEKGFFKSRERSKAEIMAGNVFVNDKRIDKPGTQVDADSIITIREKAIPYVSRGGLKLEKAIKVFDIDVNEKIAIDIGASTGGFTDCLLKNGAKKVYAVDVGYGQLDISLRNDPRVVVLERKNARYLTFEDIGEMADIITADLSFISLTKVFPALLPLLKSCGSLISLIKPQFELEKKDVGKNGIIREPQLHLKAINKIITAAQEMSLYMWGLDFSPITGPKGNIEFLALFKKILPDKLTSDPEEVVKKAHLELK